MRFKGNYVKEIALERIYILFNLARKEFKKHPERSNRYVEIARKIAMKANVSIAKEHKHSFCKKCGEYLVLGKNGTKRLRKGTIEITCGNCKNIRRFRYK